MSEPISKTIPGFYNGVSQQSPTLRLDTQGEIQENAMGTIVDGLYKRPGSEFLAKLTTNSGSDSYITDINRDLNERFIVVLTTDATDPIEVFTIDGTKCTIRYGELDLDDYTFAADAGVKDYVKTSITNPKEQFKAITVADYTFISNTQITCAMKTDTVAGSIIDSVQGFLDLPTRDNVLENGDFKYFSDDSGTDRPDDWFAANSATVEKNGTDGHRGESSLVKNGGTAYGGIYQDVEVKEGYNYSLSLRLAYVNTDYYRIRVLNHDDGDSVIDNSGDTEITSGEDDWSHEYSTSFTAPTGCNTVRISIEIKATSKNMAVDTVELVTPMDGDVFEITGDEINLFDNYYVEYVESTETYDETIKPGVEYLIDPETMPHALVHTDTTEFTLTPLPWNERTVGDDESTPVPSLIGQEINNLFFHRNRLGFLAKYSTVLSKASEYWDLFVTSAIDLLADDPIDIAAPAKEVSKLYTTAQFDKSLLLFSSQRQFELSSGDNSLTPQTATLTPTTAYQICPLCEPAAAGSNIFFVNPRDSYVSVREYMVMPDTLTDDASDITAHVNKYIPNGYIQMKACNSIDTLFLHCDEEPTNIYVYKYYWVGNSKPQSSWSKWTFDGDILGITAIETSIYFLVERATDAVGGTETCLEVINLEDNPTGDLDFRVHLDQMEEITPSYAAGTSKWEPSYDLYGTTADDWQIINKDTGFPISGFSIDVTNGWFTASGDYSASDFYVGKRYTKRYDISEWYVKDANDLPMTDGRLQVRSLTLSFTNTGYLRLDVTPHNRDTLTQEITGVKIGESVVGTVSLLSGEHKFLVMAKSKKTQISIINDSYLPSAVQTGQFEGTYVTRSRAM